MKQLSLITTNNAHYRGNISQSDYSIQEFVLPASPETLRLLETMTWCESIILEIRPDAIERCDELFKRIQNKGRIICLADAVTLAARSFLMDHGVTDVLTGPDRDRIGDYLSAVSETGQGERGRIVTLDDNETTRGVLKTIIERFNYAPDFINSVDALFNESLDASVRFILINLGTRQLDLNGLVRKFYDNRGVKKIPIIVYKDMREGLYVHELVGGLNRLTRYILSHDELYSLLVDLLFKKDIMPLIAELRRRSDFDGSTSFVDGPVSQAFFQNEKQIFNGVDILENNNFSALDGTARSLGISLARAMGLRWLKISIDKKDFNTAERGG